MLGTAQIESKKEQIRAEDREKGIYFHAGVPNIPRAVSIEQRKRAREHMRKINLDGTL